MKKNTSSPLKPLRRDIHLLGKILGDTIKEVESIAFFNTIEKLRVLSKKARTGDSKALKSLHKLLTEQKREDQIKIIKAFTEFLRLANCAEQFHRIRRRKFYEKSGKKPQIGSLDWFFKNKTITNNVDLEKLLSEIKIELVFTAHPTEALRPSAIRRYRDISQQLALLSQEKLSEYEKDGIQSELKKTIFSLWHTDILKPDPPTPVDEARSGLSIVEEILWPELPEFYKKLKWAFHKNTNKPLPPNCFPIKISSWMGGDRDGNPYVTAQVTEKIIKESCYRAKGLYRNEFFLLWQELPFHIHDVEIKKKYNTCSNTPYREVIQKVIHSIDHETWTDSYDLICSAAHDIFQSLMKFGFDKIAHSRCYDILCRIESFGPILLSLDFRQERTVHTHAVTEILNSIFNIKYEQLTSEEKSNHLLGLLQQEVSPQVQHNFTAETQELLQSLQLIKKYPKSFFGIYIVSMAEEASDILEVYFLQKFIGITTDNYIPVAPLFETPDSLKQSASVLRSLYEESFYLKLIKKNQHIMLGYSDSAKRGGKLASSWLIYKKQKEFIELEKEFGVTSIFFHGRGGSIGRGGGPIRLAFSALPRGASSHHIRITEQGESIDSKYGQKEIALRTFELYFSSTLEAILSKQNEKLPQWLNFMENLAADSEARFRNLIYKNDLFLEFYKFITPIEELSFLQIGSRPKKRKGVDSFEALRAIPWNFSWTQNRFIIPSWLGAGEGLSKAIKDGHLSKLKKMYVSWPFFKSNLDLLEMILAKTDQKIIQAYSKELLPPHLHSQTEIFLKELYKTSTLLKKITGHKKNLESNPVLLRSIQIRNSYVDILNILQIELLKEYRKSKDSTLEQAIALTISGISAGMRNTG